MITSELGARAGRRARGWTLVAVLLAAVLLAFAAVAVFLATAHHTRGFYNQQDFTVYAGSWPARLFFGGTVQSFMSLWRLPDMMALAPRGGVGACILVLFLAPLAASVAAVATSYGWLVSGKHRWLVLSGCAAAALVLLSTTLGYWLSQME